MTDAQDVHTNTVHNDVQFAAYLDAVYGPEWRAWTPEKKRALAKVYNWAKFYGARRESIDRYVAREIEAFHKGRTIL